MNATIDVTDIVIETPRLILRSRRVIEICGFSYFGESGFETQCNTVERSRNYILYNKKTR